MAETHLYVLGCGTALPSAERDNIALAVDAPGGLWLVDCGGSVYRRLLRLGLDPLRLRGVFLTHAHPDHIYGLPALLFHLKLAGWRDDGPELQLFGNGATLDLAQRVLAAFEIDLWQPPIVWHRLPEQEGHHFFQDADLDWYSTPVIHSRPTLAVQVVSRQTEHTVVFSADTEPCSSLARLARGVDTLLHECTAVEPLAGHSTPDQAGELAAQAGVRQLVVLHYDPAYIMPEKQALDRIRQAGFAGRVLFARDGLALPLGKDQD
ncbi:MAG: MBL fold metallo-hydrolase [Chloroflexota bacterium]